MNRHTNRSPIDRRRAERFGRYAEFFVAIWYSLCGYKVLARRFKAASGELDLVLLRKPFRARHMFRGGGTEGILVLAEVKYRHSRAGAIEAVGRRTRRRIEAAGRAFIAQRPIYADCGLRYDIAIVSGVKLDVLKDAWREGD